MYRATWMMMSRNPLGPYKAFTYVPGYLARKEPGSHIGPYSRSVPTYRGTSLIRKRTPLRPYGRPMPRFLCPTVGRMSPLATLG